VWLWPPFSPNLNTLHFSIWNILETRKLASNHKNFAALQDSISKVWAPLAEELARKASRRLEQIVAAGRCFIAFTRGRHHKHKLPPLFKAAKPSI
jgi:hypothetical protein